MPTRIAMWSGPRNISTAMMRSWSSRADTAVTDEPLYAHYLQVTGVAHPGRDATLARHDADWQRVTRAMTGPVPGGRRLWYQKHMAHHLTPDVGRDWLEHLTHAFLVREPAAMLLSLTEFIAQPHITDTGLPQQLSLFGKVSAELGAAPPVIDGDDVLRDPRTMLSLLCDALRVPFDEAMLAWAPGLRETDGAWASIWYGKVAATTAFGSPHVEPVEVPAHLRALYSECAAIYRELAQYRLQPVETGA